MHPGNAACTDEIFEAIRQAPLPGSLQFKIIPLIEQVNGRRWTIVRTFDLE